MDETQGTADGRAAAEHFKNTVMRKLSEKIASANFEMQLLPNKADADRNAFARYWESYMSEFESAIGGLSLTDWKI